MQKDHIKRVKIIGIIGAIYSFILLGDYFFNNQPKYQVIIACSLFLCSIVFIIFSIRFTKITKKASKK